MSAPNPANNATPTIPEFISTAYTPCSYVPMTPAARRRALWREIAVVVDVGANLGQYAEWVRSLGFAGRIISFEPQPAVYENLARKSIGDKGWECHNLALGPSDSYLDLQVANDPTATSVYAPTAQTLRNFPTNYITGVERVPMRSLSSLWPTLACQGPVYLKIDVEGFEVSVLDGAASVLDSISLVELELSIADVYSGAPLIADVVGYLGKRGFTLVAIEQSGGDDHATGEQIMCDGVFRNTRLHPSLER